MTVPTGVRRSPKAVALAKARIRSRAQVPPAGLYLKPGELKTETPVPLLQTWRTKAEDRASTSNLEDRS
jgi:hypothetical protein